MCLKFFACGKTTAMMKPLLQSICFTFDLAPEDSVTFWTQRGQPLDRERPRDILRPPCGLISNSWIALQSVSLLRVSCFLLLRPGHWRVLGVKPPWRMWGDQSVSPRGVVKRRTNRFSNWGHHIENQWWCLLRCDRVQLSICSTKPARRISYFPNFFFQMVGTSLDDNEKQIFCVILKKYVTTVVSCRKVPGVQPSLRELWVEVWILEAASLSHHFQACQRAVAECWAAKPVRSDHCRGKTRALAEKMEAWNYSEILIAH